MTEDGTGGALWYPTGTTKLSAREAMAEALSFLPEGIPYLRRALSLENEIKRHWPIGPHWYLSVLSVEPGSQGKGHGSALIQPGLDRADEEGVGAYLETQRESNIAFYERFGFELQGTLATLDSPPMWLMWRAPRPT